MTYLIGAVLGALWRRWWGSERPSWAFSGYRATQAVVGLALLFLLGLWTGEAWWRAALDAGLAIGWLTLPIKISLFGHTQFWEWLDSKVTLPDWWESGYTTYAEASGGALVFLLATSI